MGLLDGKTAVITGGAGGLGRAFAFELGAEGARIAVADVAYDGAEATAATLRERHIEAIGLALDQSDPDSAISMAAAVSSRLGPADILINNAAVFASLRRRPALEISTQEWLHVIQTNLSGAFFCCLAFMPGMCERGYGKIVNVSSSAIFAAQNGLAHYVAAKAGLVGLTRVLAREYGGSGITVNALSPGSTATGAGGNITHEYLEAKVRARSIQRVETPDDLLGTMIYLCSSMSDFVTGQNIVVDGGGVFQ